MSFFCECVFLDGWNKEVHVQSETASEIECGDTVKEVQHWVKGSSSVEERNWCESYLCCLFIN